MIVHLSPLHWANRVPPANGSKSTDCLSFDFPDPLSDCSVSLCYTLSFCACHAQPSTLGFFILNHDFAVRTEPALSVARQP
jgi:hypothetical protein